MQKLFSKLCASSKPKVQGHGRNKMKGMFLSLAALFGATFFAAATPAQANQSNLEIEKQPKDVFSVKQEIVSSEIQSNYASFADNSLTDVSEFTASVTSSNGWDACKWSRTDWKENC